MPSKIFEYMATGKPILFAGSGEAVEAVQRARAGVCVRYGEKRDFQIQLGRLLADEGYRRECGENGRNWAMRHQVRESINAAWVDAMADASCGASQGRKVQPVRKKSRPKVRLP
jgi:glycosyltransferase involved in cell wall biosynthesis